MRRQRPFAATLIALGMTLVAASAVLAKSEHAVATLDALLPIDAQPGSEVDFGWTLTVPGDGGSSMPFNAEGVFVRLLPASGEPVELVGRQDRPGHYIATVTVPTGGLSGVEIGLRGMACTAGGGCKRSDVMFRLADASDAGVVGRAADTAGSAPVGTAPVSLALIALAGAAMVGGVIVVVRRGRVHAPRWIGS